MEALLDGIKLSVHLERLDGADLAASHIAARIVPGTDRLAVHLHHAGAAVGGVAAPVCARQARRLADEMDEQLARLDLRETCSPLIVIRAFMLNLLVQCACRRTAGRVS